MKPHAVSAMVMDPCAETLLAKNQCVYLIVSFYSENLGAAVASCEETVLVIRRAHRQEWYEFPWCVNSAQRVSLLQSYPKPS